MVTAIKGSEDGGPTPDLIVRAVESSGRPARARIDLPIAGREIVADFGPSQIRTFRVPVDGSEVREVDLIEWDLAEGPHGSLAAIMTDGSSAVPPIRPAVGVAAAARGMSAPTSASGSTW
jgi:hypothetical protein